MSEQPESTAEVAHRDVVCRMRVGEILVEGCFAKGEDFAAAALI